MPQPFSYPDELRQQALRLREAGKSLRAIGQDLGVSYQTVSNWIQVAESDLPPEEREELVRLRRDVRRLQQERDVLKKAVAFFARESEGR
jgi:transposase